MTSAENATYPWHLTLESGLQTGKPILYWLQRIRPTVDSPAINSAASNAANSAAPSPKRLKARSTTPRSATPVFSSPLRSPYLIPSPMPSQRSTRSRDAVELTGVKHKTMLVNVDIGERMSSGDEIHLTTTDPEALPLPNFKILEMQWVLQCIAAMSAFAEDQDQPYIEDDDDFDDLPVMAYD
ncbi:hypothetical protein Egran_03520 [Elaphomyces granulatus]|uniref:Uncharacterized protein n=1 Tax=Elaphomyces granulatus TaxID=519963 RepID=A0A232LY31_9EURO|nr:hypothetical protein Egran_03520 [Elaphomyces granulatus]